MWEGRVWGVVEKKVERKKIFSSKNLILLFTRKTSRRRLNVWHSQVAVWMKISFFSMENEMKRERESKSDMRCFKHKHKCGHFLSFSVSLCYQLEREVYQTDLDILLFYFSKTWFNLIFTALKNWINIYEKFIFNKPKVQIFASTISERNFLLNVGEQQFL